MAKRYGGDPFWTNARFTSKCACGNTVNRGERVFYYPNVRRVLCASCSDKAERDFAAAKQDEAFMTGNTY